MSILDLAGAHTTECCLAQEKATGLVFGTGNFKNPVVCETAAVHPDQIKERCALLRLKGVPTEHDHEGRPILTSNIHKRKFCKALGFTTRDEYY